MDRPAKSVTATRRDVLRWCASLPLLAFGESQFAAAAPEPSWRVTGPPTPNFEAFDAAMRQFMQREGVTAGQLAIYYKSAYVLNHGYTNAATRPAVEPTSLFR